jgi:hypothetical protein
MSTVSFNLDFTRMLEKAFKFRKTEDRVLQAAENLRTKFK